MVTKQEKQIEQLKKHIKKVINRFDISDCSFDCGNCKKNEKCCFIDNWLDKARKLVNDTNKIKCSDIEYHLGIGNN